MKRMAVKIIYSLYKVFSTEYRLLEAIKNKRELTAIVMLKMNKNLLKYTDNQGWNIIDHAHLFNCNKVQLYIKSKCKINHSESYKLLLININFNKALKLRALSGSLEIIKKSFISINNVSKMDVNNIQEFISVFIRKNGY